MLSETKICSKCRREFPRTEEYFYKSTRKFDGLYYYCKECFRAMRRERNRTGKDSRAKANEYARNFKERHKDELREWAKNYLKTEKGKIYKARRNVKRRDLTKQTEINLTLEQWENCKDYFRDNNGVLHCAYCNKTIQKATKEHFIPLAKGGEFTINNVLPVCKSCNSGKRDNDFFTWYPKQSFYCKKRENKILKYLHYKGNFQQLVLL